MLPAGWVTLLLRRGQFIEMNWDLYLHDMRHNKAWGGNVEINALSQIYGMQFCIFRELPAPSVDGQYASFIKEDAGGASIRRVRVAQFNM